MSLPPSTSDKNALRHELLEKRRHITEQDRLRWDASIGARLEQRFSVLPVATLGVFWPIRKEPDLHPLYQRLAARGMQLALPVVVGKDEPLRFAAWTPGDLMEKDSFGVPVPAHEVFVPIPEALLVPCVGFNLRGYRLGYGGGFYDRTLAASPKPYAIGIAYACQRTEFDIDAYDVALDLILTEA